MALIPLSAIATENIEQFVLLIIDGDSAKPFRYGTSEYANAYAETSAKIGERVIYRKLSFSVQVVSPKERETDAH